jgi:alpha-1,6-mannosyltransferase
MLRMRIVQVANFYGPRSGGLRTAVDRLGAEYCAAGNEVFLIVPGRVGAISRMPTGVTRIGLPARVIPFTGGYRAVPVTPVIELLDRLHPDAIEVSDRFTLRPLGAWGARRGVRTVMVSHERLDRLTGQILPVPLARRVADFANRRTAADYDTVLCTTGFAREEFERIGATNLLTVPLGVDLETFHPRRYCSDTRRQLASPRQVLLVHCGRLSIEKRVDRSIATLAALRDGGLDARLVIAGDGPLRGRLERQATGLPVRFTGFVDSRPAVAELLACADVAIAPGPHETFGLAALEALACGTPAVVSRTSALAEILTADSGAAAANDPRALAGAVTEVLARPVPHRRLCARRRAENFSWPHAAAGMLAALGGPGG